MEVNLLCTRGHPQKQAIPENVSLTLPSGTVSVEPISETSDSTVEKTIMVSRSRIGDFFKGLAKSRIVRALLFVALAIGTLFLIVSNPVGWLIAVVAIGAVVIAGTALFVQRQKVSFECTALSRLLKKQDYDEIQFKSRFAETPNFKLFLGALPNRLSNDGERLAKEGIGAVISLNELDWETSPIGLSNPYNDDDWTKLKIWNYQILAKDHEPLSDYQLDLAADSINFARKQGLNVYVHCRAGRGRSSMAIAAYLIKHEGKTVDEAAAIILAPRPKATIMKKIDRLNDYVIHHLKKPELASLVSPPKDLFSYFR
jgi:atypical dual specificity phosphatase